MAYQNQKVKARQTVAQSNTQSKDLGIVSVVPMDEWNATTPYQKLNKVRYVSTGGSGVTLLAKQQNQGVEPFVSQGWQEVWMVENYDGGAVSPDGTYPEMAVGNSTNAQNDGNGKNIVEQFAAINEKIPSTASADNQLADKAFVNSSINNSAAFYITSNAQGDAFSTKAALIAATTFYSGGQLRVPTQNDYATVLSDESQPAGVNGTYPTTRYTYQTNAQNGQYPNGQWDLSMVVNNTTLTQAQLDAINSGITKEIVDSLGDGDVIPTGTYPDMAVGKLSTARAIDGVLFDGTASITHYGVCSTTSGTTAKTVACEGFVLVTGARITVNFSTANTVSQPTLNVNNAGAKEIRCKGRSTGIVWKAEIITFLYDGTYWQIIGGYSLADKPVNSHLVQRVDEETPAALFGGTWEVDTRYAGRAPVYYGTTGNPLYKGAYSTSAQYDANDIVSYNQNYYVAKQATKGNLPTNTTYWTSYQNGAVGGEARHALTAQENGEHYHAVYGANNIQRDEISSFNSTGAALPAVASNNFYSASYYDSAAGTTTHIIGDAGAGEPHNIMQPYIVETMWKRTA